MSIKCQNCGTENVDNAKYCCECGNEIGSYCRKCGTFNRSRKFCISCGAKNDPVDCNNASTNPNDYSHENVYEDESGTYTADRLVFLKGNYDAKKIEIRQGTHVICDDAFASYQIFNRRIRASVEEIIIPDSVTQIGDEAFKNCRSLQSIGIPDSVTQIGNGAFGNCSSLQAIVIPDSVTQIGNGVFKNCSSLQTIVVSEDNTIYDSRNNCNAIIETKGNILVAGCGQTIIPDSVAQIGCVAFCGCESLQFIVIPDSVTQIGDGAFCGCECLQSIDIPDSVTQIGDWAFGGCLGLQSIVIPDSVVQIGHSAFCGCSSLQTIVIPDSVMQIGDAAFSNCSSLQTIVMPDSITQIEDATFWECISLQTIVIPKGTKEKFENLIPEYAVLLQEQWL